MKSIRIVAAAIASIAVACGSASPPNNADAASPSIDGGRYDGGRYDGGSADYGGRADVGAVSDGGMAGDASTRSDSSVRGFDASAIDAMSSPLDASGPIVEVGTGESMFESVTTGEKLIFNAGPQGGGRIGGYNIWGGVRASGIMPNGVTVTFTLTSTAGEIMAMTTRMESLQSDGSGGSVVYAIPVLLHDCCRAVAHSLTLRLDFTDLAGTMLSDQRQVLGADSCPPSPMNPTFDPCR